MLYQIIKQIPTIKGIFKVQGLQGLFFSLEDNKILFASFHKSADNSIISYWFLKGSYRNVVYAF